MNIDIGIFLGMIVFFLGVIFLIIAYYTRKTAKNENHELSEVSQYIIEEIEKSANQKIVEIKELVDEMDKKIKFIEEKEKIMEDMFLELSKNKKITPKLVPMDDKKKEIHRLHKEGLTVEKISQQLKVHKGVIETVLNIGEYQQTVQ